MTPRWIRRAVAIAALAIAGTVAPTTAAHAASSRAVIVIGNSTYTISFNGTISGLQALQMTASVETVNFGGQLGSAVCKINGVGNPPTAGTCLIGPGGAYWRYFRAAPGATGWSYSSTGASGTSVTDGSVEGWYYGAGGSPPFHSFCSVAGCGPPPAPVTTAPPPPVAVAPTGGPAGKGSTSTSTIPNGVTAPPGTGGTTTSTSVAGRDEPEDQASGAPPSGRPKVVANNQDGDGSPVGVVVAGGVVLALGGTGLWLRRRRVAG